MSKEIFQKDCFFISKDFRKLFDELNVVQSFFGRGCLYDNAVAESVFKYLKNGKLKEAHKKYPSYGYHRLAKYVRGKLDYYVSDNLVHVCAGIARNPAGSA